MSAYHLRRNDLAVESKDEIVSLLREGKYATLALAVDGQPYAVTLNYGYSEADNALYFHSAATGRKIEMLRANPRSCATIVRDEGYQAGRCTHHYTSVVLEGPVEFLETREAKLAAFRVLFRHLEAEYQQKEEKLAGMSGDLDTVAVFKLSIHSVRAKHGNG